MGYEPFDSYDDPSRVRIECLLWIIILVIIIVFGIWSLYYGPSPPGY